MGNPFHYSQELPERCIHIVNQLLPVVEDISFPGQEHLGPLTTTFLLAMAFPMISLPIERIERHRGKAIAGYMNERPLNRGLAEEVDKVLGARLFETSPFFEKGNWRYAAISYDGENLVEHFPEVLADKLSATDALDAASRMQTSEWASCLRNAVSHGGILYLDRYGRPHHDQTTEMLAFVSAKYPKYSAEEHPKGTSLHGKRDTSQRPEELKVLRITEAGFLSFLRLWVDWVRSSGLSRALAA